MPYNFYYEFLTAEDEATSRRYWLAGLCPCCGFSIEVWPDVDGKDSKPVAIGEGVVLCGRCASNKHQDIPDLVEWLLRSVMGGKK
jgi:hypothetical protein